jgi:hypothetical protein
MLDMKAAVPLTFALALSAAAPNAATAAVGDPSDMLKPGGLRNLVSLGESVVGDRPGGAREDQDAKRKVAQCFAGYWRRC